MTCRRLRPITTVTVTVAVAFAASCTPATSTTAPTTTPTTTPTPAHPAAEAIADRAFGDNPLVEFAPSDTPYAFASFKPIPLAAFRKLAKLVGPSWRRNFAKYMTKASSGTDDEITGAVLQALDDLDVDKLEQLGFSPKARYAIYGLGIYPVARIEISSGDRVFATLQSATSTIHSPVPAPTVRAGHRYWIFGNPDVSVFVAIGATEVVVAAAPPALIVQYLAMLLGEQRPAHHLTVADFRALAMRDGFTGQGLGYADVSRIGTMLTARQPIDCRSAVEVATSQVPRIAFGYDDFTEHHMAAAVIAELAPAVVAEARAIRTSLPGLDLAMTAHAAMTFVAGADVEKARQLAARALDGSSLVVRSCDAAAVADTLTGLARTIRQPLPPAAVGLHGGYIVVQNFTKVASGPMPTDGFAMVEFDDTSTILAYANKLLGFALGPDHLPHALPSLLPVTGHAAASPTVIGLGLGADSAEHAMAVLDGTRAQAPLVMVAFDYRQLGDLFISKSADDADTQREIMNALGRVAAKLVIDGRGLVASMSIEMR